MNFCAPKARIHRHHQNVIHDVQNFRKRVHRRCRIDHYPSQAVVTLDQVQRPVQMPAGLLMHRYPIDSGFGECRNELVRILDHQVAIQRQIGHLAQRFYNRRPDRKIGNEVAVHDIDMDDTRPALACGAYLLAQSSKISRKNGRSQFDQNPGASVPAFSQGNGVGKF